jgi:hypothetical protein
MHVGIHELVGELVGATDPVAGASVAAPFDSDSVELKTSEWKGLGSSDPGSVDAIWEAG